MVLYVCLLVLLSAACVVGSEATLPTAARVGSPLALKGEATSRYHTAEGAKHDVVRPTPSEAEIGGEVAELDGAVGETSAGVPHTSVPGRAHSIVVNHVDETVEDEEEAMLRPPPPPPRVIAIGDIHGDLFKFKTILRAANITDDEDHWRKDCTATVVQLGDIAGRGAHYHEVYDYIAHLEREAREAMGQFIMLLGNHELLHLVGDTSKGNKQVKRMFQSERRYNEAFSPSGAYGRFLLEHKVVHVHDHIVFVHGGLTPEFAAYGAVGINEAFVAGFQYYRSPLDYSHPPIYPHPFSSENSPLYDRSVLEAAKRGDCVPLRAALAQLSLQEGHPIDSMVVGHTPQNGGIMRRFCDDQLIAVDVRLSEATRKGGYLGYAEWTVAKEPHRDTAEKGVAFDESRRHYRFQSRYPLGRGVHVLAPFTAPVEPPHWAWTAPGQSYAERGSGRLRRLAKEAAAVSDAGSEYRVSALPYGVFLVVSVGAFFLFGRHHVRLTRSSSSSSQSASRHSASVVLGERAVVGGMKSRSGGYRLKL